MPAYATIADMQARFPAERLIQLTDDDATGAIVDARLTRAIEQASNTVDGYVSAHYRRASESAPIPPLLVDLACDIAYFRLWRNESPPEAVSEAHKAAIAQLTQIAKGVVKIDQGEETVPAREGMILIETKDRIFGRDNMAGF